jgi:GGDEF domain-containing protein
MTDGPHGARVPRAVADVPPPALADGEAVAKAWLLELLAAAPLERAAAVPVAELAARGPSLCAAVLAAIGSTAELERLAAGGDRAALAADAGALAGAADAAGAAAAVAALRRAAWATLRAELRDLDAATTAALAERVAYVADVVTDAVLARSGAAEPALPDARVAAAAGVAADTRDARLEADLAGAEEPWRVAVERALEARARDGARFALLAVEAADAERLVAAGGGDAAALVAFERGARAAARPGDTVVRERPGRLWIVAPGLEADAARALAQRIAEAAPDTAAPHGVPLAASAGVAACPEDGTDAAALAARADERLFAARAAGVPVL